MPTLRTASHEESKMEMLGLLDGESDLPSNKVTEQMLKWSAATKQWFEHEVRGAVVKLSSCLFRGSKSKDERNTALNNKGFDAFCIASQQQ